MEGKNKAKGNTFNRVIITLCVIISLCLVVSILYVLGVFGPNRFNLYEEKEIPYSGKESKKDNISDTSTIFKENENIDSNEEPEEGYSDDVKDYIDVDNVYVVYKGVLYVKTADETNEEEFILYKDGTYFKTSCYFTCAASKGTYEMSKDKISLHETIQYGADNCYYTSDKSLDLAIKNNNIITTSNAGKVTMKKSNLNDVEQILYFYSQIEDSKNCDEKDSVSTNDNN